MNRELTAEPLTRAAFAPFGRVIETEGAERRTINGGACTRFHALCDVPVIGEGARVILNVFRTEPSRLPLSIAMMERHPLGAQAFRPLSSRDWLVVVAPDEDGAPGRPRAFHARADQGVAYAIGTWHHPLIALHARCDFLVADRGGPGDNLEEVRLKEPFIVTEAAGSPGCVGP